MTYKAQANLTVASKSHLESCFGDEVTVVLFGRLGQEGWDILTEETLLDNVKEVFVKKRNRMINRLKLQSQVQGPDQPVQQYIAALKQIARTCKYRVKCSKDGCDQNVDYSNEMVLDQLVKGLNDDEIQKKVLSSKEDEFNLQNVEKIIVAEECSKATQKESKSTLPSEQIAQMSAYKRNKRAMATQNQKQDSNNCKSCGEEGHKSYFDLPSSKKADCKAHRKFCERCGRPNHLTALCRTAEHNIRTSSSARSESDNEDKDLPPEHNVLQLMSLSVEADNRKSTKSKSTRRMLDLEKYKYIIQRDIPDPIEASKGNKFHVNVKLDAGIFRDLGGTCKLSKYARKFKKVKAIPDTGANACFAPLKMVRKLGIKMCDTFLSNTSLFTADRRKLDIKGYVPVVFTTLDSEGNKVLVRDLLYFVKNLKEVFISHQVLIDLGTIPPNFPEMISVKNTTKADMFKESSGQNAVPKEESTNEAETNQYEVEGDKAPDEINWTWPQIKDKYYKEDGYFKDELLDEAFNNYHQKEAEAAATKTSILSLHEGNPIKEDQIDVVGGEIVDSTDGVVLDDGPDGVKVVAKAAQLIPFLSRTVPAETMWSRIIPVIRAKALASDSHIIL